MKRFVLCLPVVLLFSGCAQVFQGNAFQSIDQPPALSASALAAESDSTIVTQITSDSSFVTSLKSNPAALAAVQGVLLAASQPTSSASAATKITDAQAYITATTGATAAGAVVQTAMSQVQNLANASSGTAGSTAASALTSIFAGQTITQIQATLNQFVNMAGALTNMQAASAQGGTVDSTAFFGNTPSKLNLGMTAALAATVNAFASDLGGGTAADGVATLATYLQNGTTLPTNGAAVGNLTTALTTSNTPTSNPYAYLSAVTGLVKTS
jgi:hypothetical protein